MPTTENLSKELRRRSNAKAVVAEASEKKPQGFKYRGRTDIVHDILNTFFDSVSESWSPKSKTAIMYRAFLSYAQLKEYLALLISRELISYEDATRHYHITEKGKEFMQIYKRMADDLLIRDRAPSGDK